MRPRVSGIRTHDFCVQRQETTNPEILKFKGEKFKNNNSSRACKEQEQRPET